MEKLLHYSHADEMQNMEKILETTESVMSGGGNHVLVSLMEDPLNCRSI